MVTARENVRRETDTADQPLVCAAKHFHRRLPSSLQRTRPTTSSFVRRIHTQLITLIKGARGVLTLKLLLARLKSKFPTARPFLISCALLFVQLWFHRCDYRSRRRSVNTFRFVWLWSKPIVPLLRPESERPMKKMPWSNQTINRGRASPVFQWQTSSNCGLNFPNMNTLYLTTLMFYFPLHPPFLLDEHSIGFNHFMPALEVVLVVCVIHFYLNRYEVNMNLCFIKKITRINTFLMNVVALYKLFKFRTFKLSDFKTLWVCISELYNFKIELDRVKLVS